MFNHSIKVPKLYKVAAKYAEEVKEKGGSLKQLVYKKKHPNVKAIYALVIQLMRKYQQLDDLIKRSKILEKENRLDPWLARILITELLWGKKQLLGESKPIKTILAYKQTLKAHFPDVQKQTFEDDSVKIDKPRYVRVNTLKMSVNDAVKGFEDEGRRLVGFLGTNYDEFLSKVKSLEEDEFMVDLHMKDLLIFPPNTQFYMHSAYKNGSIILQDKASCLPVHLLKHPEGSTVLDMCASPGMKTAQLASVLKNEGTVFAVEINKKRFKTLNELIAKYGCTCVKTINKDVIRVTAKDCPNVEYILVDPSCSGSGILDRVEPGKRNKRDEVRLKKLAGFQIKILKHALRNFPGVKRIVYSTCSVYPQENEAVVKEVIGSTTRFKLVPAGEALDGPWSSFGSPDFGDIGKYCLYSRPEKDLTNGFFIAVFEPLEEGEKNQFYSGLLTLKTGRNEGNIEEKRGKKMKRKRKLSEVLKHDVGEVISKQLPKNKKKRKGKVGERMTENIPGNGVDVVGVLEAKQKKKTDGSIRAVVHARVQSVGKKKKGRSQSYAGQEIKGTVPGLYVMNKKKQKNEAKVGVTEENSGNGLATSLLSIGKKKKKKSKGNGTLLVSKKKQRKSYVVNNAG